MNFVAFPTKSERKRPRIVANAAELLWERSFNGVSVDEIGSAAGINKATVYRYFADKGELALASARLRKCSNTASGSIERLTNASQRFTITPISQM